MDSSGSAATRCLVSKDAANNTSPMAPSPAASITVTSNPQRNNTNDTLNFLIPPAWCSGTVAYEIEVRVTGFGPTAGFAGFNQSTTFNTGFFTFSPRRTLEFRYIRVNWGGSTPTQQVCFDTLRTALGASFEGIEIDSAPGNAAGIAPSAHSVLTISLVDEPGHPTRGALDRVLSFLAEQLPH